MRALQYDLPVIPVILLFCVGPVPGFVRFRQKSELKSGVGQVSSKSQCEIRQNLGFTSGPPRELDTKFRNFVSGRSWKSRIRQRLTLTNYVLQCGPV